MSSSPSILDLGCGNSKTAGALGMDILPGPQVDLVHDLNRLPWPFEDGGFDAIHCRDVLEHLEDIPRVLQEIHRVARKGARVHITTPHYSCANAYTDPTHRQRLGFFSFDYVTGASPLAYYSTARYALVKRAIIFHPGLKNVLVWRLANRWPAFYERHLAWILPAWFLSVELEVLK